MVEREHSHGGAAQHGPTAEDLRVAARSLDVALGQLHAALARRLQVSQPELMAIAHVRAEGVLGPSELAHRIGVTTGAVTALVDRLAERGHLERHPHPADRRKLLLTVTAHAREELLRHAMPVTQDIEALADTFSEDERSAIARFLEGLTAIVARHAEGEPGGEGVASADNTS